MERNLIKTKLIDLISKLYGESLDKMDVIEFLDLKDDLGMDSMTFISLVVEIENDFEIIIPDECMNIDSFRSVQDIEKIIMLQMQKTNNGDI